MSYVVRVERWGDLVREVHCADFEQALRVAVELGAVYPRLEVNPYNPENIDLGNPLGLTRDERERWLEVAP